MTDSETGLIGLIIGLLSAVIAFVAAVWARVSAKAAERSAEAATRSAAAAERNVELKEQDWEKRQRSEAVDGLAASWARGWGYDNTAAAIELIPDSLLPEFRELVKEAWAKNPRAPKRSADEIVDSHLKRNAELRALLGSD